MNLARVRRALARRLAEPDAPISQRRQTSFPFISGDTVRAVCDVVVDHASQVDAGIRALADRERATLFSSVDAVEPLLLALGDDLAARVRLVVHNGDILPAKLLGEHAARFERVFAVNWLGDREIIEPLPIGLENAWIGVNGVWPLFQDCVPAHRPARLAGDRSRTVLLAFSDSTCPDTRGSARATFLSSGLDVDAPDFLDVRAYHRRLRNTLFVPSPRGNGVDCHRTWEAIYAGAVPVVLRRDWTLGHLQLPVLVVDEWADAVERIATGAHPLHQQILSESSDEVFAWAFLRPILERR